MSVADVTHACGHFARVVIDYRFRDRASAVEWLSGRPCLDCVRAARIAERQVEGAKAIAALGDLALPLLTGSEKQIAWAVQIRAKAVPVALRQPEYHRPVWTVVIYRLTSAAWWCDRNREDPAGVMSAALGQWVLDDPLRAGDALGTALAEGAIDEIAERIERGGSPGVDRVLANAMRLVNISAGKCWSTSTRRPIAKAVVEARVNDASGAAWASCRARLLARAAEIGFDLPAIPDVVRA